MANLAVAPGFNAPLVVAVQNRTYTGVFNGTPIIVPDFDALTLMANGWLAMARDGAGTTAQRPTLGPGNVINPKLGHEYYDSTLGITILWNGKNWIRVDTGASA